MNFQKGTVQSLNVHVLPTNRFKTFTITLFAGTPLQEETVTSTALIPYVLRRGTANKPETIALREQLDELYGAGFGFNITKRGNTQFVQFRMDVINDRFVNSEVSLLSEAIKYVGQMVTQPLVENGEFRPTYVDAEKQTLQKQLESVINDKIRYASERCMEEMCANEPYRLNVAGRLEDLPHVDARTLFDRYQQWLTQAQLDIYVVGDTTLEEVMGYIEQYFTLPDRSPQPYERADVQHNVDEVKTIVEQLDVNQGKLNLGLRMNTGYASPNYAAALVYNGILGGYPHSKLFVNVREKESLAYYCASRLDGHKGILSIQSGIEFANYEKALKIIEQQIAEMKTGNITEVELSQTIAMLSNSLREMFDNANDMLGFDFNNRYANTNRTIDQLLTEVQSISISDVQAVAQQVELDTIYFLRDRQEV
ncbi:EF-P 5-aminopentanol modification-associated protein YfmF [Paenibacillus endoradicis]|uniref:EF-P 5-aminopentanol modification-associated protein YfmF n=1 Tax=Paenibacillus endoradicis TaxID=2972487 RepID=UPI0021594914|nr:pitrilysin family protein [Paenibacillus endoradicis]MCR8656321.1 insulinase family protein [Paenibacillus endoradicis]